MREQAAELGEVGAGIQLSPNANKALAKLGVELSESFAPEAVEMRLGVSGRKIFSIALGAEARTRWGAPYVNAHRADLLAALLARAKALGVTIELGQTYAGDAVEADLLVGADGLRSHVRSELLGADAPRFTGSVAWRALVPAAELDELPPPTACAWAGGGKHVVTYYLRGGSLVNFVGIITEAETGEESWDARGSHGDLLARFGGMHPVIEGIVNAARDVRRWPLYDRAPLPFWHRDKRVVIGDAAHPMLPSLAQGSAMALEDAVALAEWVERPEGLAGFYAARIERVSRVQRNAAQNLALFHQKSPLSKLRHYAPLYVGSRLLPQEGQRRMDWLYGREGSK